MDMNRVPESILHDAPVLARRMAAGDTRVLVRDSGGQLRFNAGLDNADALRRCLDDGIPAAQQRAILDAYESVFHHASFTGRSGAMYRYEGIGCIYWHMVAKLWLAVLEATALAADSGTDAPTIAALRRHADEIRAGLGFTKSPAEFGAFPLDAYSHTPAFGGASQPGMTGQVKEEILARWIELGVRVENGCLAFEPARVHAREFLREPRDLHYIDTSGVEQAVRLAPGELAFTYCQVPVVYTPAAETRLTVVYADEHVEQHDGGRLPPVPSGVVFSRSGSIRRITVQFKPA
jgi:hypothetical protein